MLHEIKLKDKYIDPFTDLDYAEAKGFDEGKMEGKIEGLAEGIEKGIEKGKIERNIEIAKELKSLGIPIEQIATATKLQIEDIKKL